MASTFGVQLKKADDPGSSSAGSGGSRTPGGARRSEFKTQPVSDLKAIFDKKDEGVMGKKTSTSAISSAQKTTVTKTGMSNMKGDAKTTSTVTTSKTKDVSSQLNKEDRYAFEALKNKLNKTGIEKLIEDDKHVAVAKTYSGGKAYKATIETKKVNTALDEPSSEVSKSTAASMLSFGLTKLRTRPGGIKGDEEKLFRGNSVEETEKGPSSPRSSPLKSDSTGARDKDSKYIPGAAKGWKKSSGQTDETDKTGKFNGSLVGKVREEVKQESKVKGFRSVSPVLSVNSSDESSGSINLSPRGYKSSGLKAQEKKTDINENIRKFETSKSDSNLLKLDKSDSRSITAKNKTESLDSKQQIKKTDSKPKFSAVEQLALGKEKIRSDRNSGSFSSDSEKGKRSPKIKSEMKWVEKGRVSLEEFKKKERVKGEGHRPLSRTSSSGSNSSLKHSEDKGIQSRIERFGSPEPASNTQKHESRLAISDVKRKEFAVSKRISTEKFQDIKKGFETKNVSPRSDTSSAERKPKIEMPVKQKILERKQSFEDGVVFRQKSYEKKEIISPRDRGNVLKTVQALKELDAKAKKQPTIVRRTKSLPIESMGDDSSVDYEDIGDAPYYHDISGLKLADDISNEGDISSEADLYEEIPANMMPDNQGRYHMHT